MTKQEAKELCILKWEYIVENNGSDEGLTNRYPQLKGLMANCAYCELYIKDKFNKCYGCPIAPKNIQAKFGCRNDEHPWIIWYYESTKENAQAVLDLIKNS